MGWVTLSLRKITLTQRVSALEHRLTKISQEQQTLANCSAYEERAIGIEKQQAYSKLITDYSQGLNDIASGFNASSGSQIQDLANYQVQIQQSQLDYLYNKMMIDSVFTQKEQMLQDQVNAKQTYLELEQEQIETQLQAARAEREQLDEAISQDIQSSTISLT